MFLSFFLILNGASTGVTSEWSENNLRTPDGNLTSAEWLTLSTLTTRLDEPELREYWTPFPGISSKFEIFFSLVAVNNKAYVGIVRLRLNINLAPPNRAKAKILDFSDIGKYEHAPEENVTKPANLFENGTKWNVDIKLGSVDLIL